LRERDGRKKKKVKEGDGKEEKEMAGEKRERRGWEEGGKESGGEGSPPICETWNQSLAFEMCHWPDLEN